MFEEYKKRVKFAYLQKQKEGSLSINLRQLSPAKLRDECLVVLKDRPEEEAVLNSFFGANNERSYEQIITNIDIDKFKPIIYFLKNRSRSPEHKHIELLAWLIDFKPRPYNSNSIILSDNLEEENEKSYTKQIKESRFGRLFKSTKTNLIIASTLVLSSLSGMYLTMIDEPQKCMIWKSDHYEVISCDEIGNGGIVIPLDEQKRINFKKINRTDTITTNSIGKIYYHKGKDSLELYTYYGFHPIYRDKMVKPLSEYMFEKYSLGVKKSNLN